MSAPALAQSPPTAPDKIALGDWQLAPTLELRTRAEYRRDPADIGGLDFYGQLTERVRDQWDVSERARLGLGAERGALRAQLTLQDARALGGPSPTATFGGSQGLSRFAPYEALIEMRSSSARPTYLRLGRQAVVWGEGRMIGSADFSPVGRSLDAGRAHLAVGNFDFEALAVLLELPGPLGASFAESTGPTHAGAQLYGLTAKWTIDPLLRVEAFGLARVARSGGGGLDGSRFSIARFSGERYTASLRVSGDSKGWDYGVEGAYQFGNAEALSADIEAYAAAAHVQKTLPEIALTPTLRLGGSYASGDDRGSKVRQFDPLLPDPQRFHGLTDLFAWSNQLDLDARVELVPWTDTSFAIGYRYARLADSKGEWIGAYMNAIGRPQPGSRLVRATPDPNASTDSELGHELDVAFAWRPWLPLELKFGWSGLLYGDGARAIMAAHARGKLQDDGTIKTEKMGEYVFAQATLNVP